LLRSFTLSSASGKEGLEDYFSLFFSASCKEGLEDSFFTLFATCRREGRQAKRGRGESTNRREICKSYFESFIFLNTHPAQAGLANIAD